MAMATASLVPGQCSSCRRNQAFEVNQYYVIIQKLIADNGLSLVLILYEYEYE